MAEDRAQGAEAMGLFPAGAGLVAGVVGASVVALVADPAPVLRLVVQPLLLSGPDDLGKTSAYGSWLPVIASSPWFGHRDFLGAAQCGPAPAARGAAPAPERA